MRESNEEINLNGEDITKLGKLNYLISRHKIEVNPFVASIDKPQSLKPNEEIQDIFTVPLNFLLDKENIQREAIERHGSIWQVPTWSIKNQKIWGLTAMITVNFLNVCFDANIEILEGECSMIIGIDNKKLKTENDDFWIAPDATAVSYTHLTLPTT